VVRTASSKVDKESLSHNLLGQRLGRKGRDTRERILAATDKLLAGPPETAISLSAVAREASLGMTTLYLYFSDLTELLLAVLGPIMASAETSYARHLRSRWPDDGMGEHCLKFVVDYYDFWERHARILHLRNSFADNNDERMRAFRISSSQPIIAALIKQMECDLATGRSPVSAMATVLMTGIERMVTVSTDVNFRKMMTENPAPHVHTVHNLLVAEARLLEMGICDGRATSRGRARS
jgi:AcrR family transcriptional regulator